MQTQSYLFAGAVFMLLCNPVRAQEPAAPAAIKVAIAAQRLDKALNAWAEQTGFSIMIPMDHAPKDRMAPKVDGVYKPEEALKLLLASSGLRYEFVGARTVAIRGPKDAAPDKTSQAIESNAAQALQLAQVENATAATHDPIYGESPEGASDGKEMIVTGSRIRQAEKYGPSPVNSYDSEYIRSTGALTVADFLNKIPQTYGGVANGRSSAPNELNLEFGQSNEGMVLGTPAPGGSPFNAAPGQPGVSGVSLRGMGSGSTLVLIDGRRIVQSGNGNQGTTTGQGFTDVSTIPLSMIDRIDIITDGASAIYGADAVAGVINIILKHDWTGTELTATRKFNDAAENQITLTSGFSSGRLQGSVSLESFNRGNLFASERGFSRNMDHRNRTYRDAAGNTVSGSDHRIQWGYASTLQAAFPNQTFTAFPGVRVLLSPEGATSAPALNQFIPRTSIPPGQPGSPENPAPPGFPVSVNAQGQRATDVSDQLMLVPEAERYGATGTLNYAFSDALEAYGTYTFSDNRGESSSFPFYTNNFQGTLHANSPVNPFGQNVQFGMIHHGFGPESVKTHTESHNAAAGLRGDLPGNWRWDANAQWQRQDFTQRSRRFNRQLFSSLVSQPDFDDFNPFIDYSAPGAPDVSEFYAQVTYHPVTNARSSLKGLNLLVDGRLFDVRGGQVRTAIGASWEQPRVENYRTDYRILPQLSPFDPAGVVDPGPFGFSRDRINRAIFGELSLPIVGGNNALPLLRRLELTLAGRIDDNSEFGNFTTPKYGMSWRPVESLLVRASWSKGFRAPSLTENNPSPGNGLPLGLEDPLRPGEFIDIGVNVIANPDLRPEKSTNLFYGLVWEPAFVPGLSLQANYYRTDQEDAISYLGETFLLQNEALFPGFIVRGPGNPGPITEFNVGVYNIGKVHNETADFIAEYRLPVEATGTWRVGVNASHPIEFRRLAYSVLADGYVETDDTGDTLAPPKWKILTTVFWNRGAWNASASLDYLSGFKSNGGASRLSSFNAPPSAVSQLDLSVGYTFRGPLFAGFGEGLRTGLRIDNVLDKDPPFTDVIWAFNSALHSDYIFGRTFELSFTLPF